MVSEEQEADKEVQDDTGLHAWIIQRIGWDGFVEMCRIFGGQKIYIPKRPYNDDRNVEIRRQFGRIIELSEGPDMNRIYESLANTFGLTASGIRHILFDRGG